jgi:hypothetical protein
MFEVSTVVVLQADYLVGRVSNLPVAVDSHDELLVKK